MLDLETTGLDPRTDRVVEVAVVTTDVGGRVIDEWSSLVHPGRDPGPTDVHGITAHDLCTSGSYASVAGELAERLRGSVLVAHNLAFDAAFLAAEDRHLVAAAGGASGAATGPPAVVLGGPSAGLCTLELSRRVLARPDDGWSLGALCGSVGVPLVDPHRALVDARATAGLLEALLGEVGAPGTRPRLLGRRLTVRAAPG